MTAWQYILASLRQFRRVHVAVAAGVAVASAVITGALLVGDSMRGSLRDLALGSLGRIDSALLAERPFREALASEWLQDAAVKEHFDAGAPLLLMNGALSLERGGKTRRAGQLDVIGAPPEFWSLGEKPSHAPELSSNQIALTEAIASELGARVGDVVLLRLPTIASVPADSTLGEKEEVAAARRLTVAAVFSQNDEQGLARFSLRPSQQPPRNVFVPLETLQSALQLDGRVNAVVLAAEAAKVDEATDDDALARATAALRPDLEDYGVRVEKAHIGAPPSVEYLRITADRLVIAPHVVDVAKELYGDEGVQPVVTYLANVIVAGDRRIPYSTVAGVDSTTELGPVVDDEGRPIQLGDDEIALNDWTAKELRVEVGDKVTITWYEPETTHGELREHAPRELTVRAILPLATPEVSLTAAADPNFAPELPGVTDQASIDDWDLPFALVEKIRPEDEAYWDEHRTTPKAFVSHTLAARLWRTRWGVESVLRLPAQKSVEAVAANLRAKINPREMGMALLPVKQQALAAAAGTTPFDGLFLGFSFFLMASAVILVALLFRLGIEQRASEVGLLRAVGMAPRRLRRLMLAEAAIVAATGAVLGAAAGVGYAAVMVHGLNTWWVDATASPFLRLHITPRSIAAGAAAGLLVALVAITWSLWRYGRTPARQLLSGDAEPPRAATRPARWLRTALPVGCLAAAIALGLAALQWEGEAQAGAFFGGGALALVGALMAIHGWLREDSQRPPVALGLVGLAACNARRNPSRTMLSMALSALASFLIVALSAFRLEPSDRGVGGFDLLATSDVPLQYDLNSASGRDALGFSAEDSRRLKDAAVLGFRVHDGEDASCLNLYQPSQPRILGAPPELAEQSSFAWAGLQSRAPISQSGEQDGWAVLDQDLGADAGGAAIVPAVLDRNTAYYSLKKKLGTQFTIRDGFNRPVTIQICGLLANSVLQGDVIVSDSQFRRLFAEDAGRRFFLIRNGAAAETKELTGLLETQLEDYGFDAVDARERLGELMAVQNTYLSTFQSLGALGLLLGVVGLAVVQLRSVIERRGELALMQAAGFRRRRLARMVLTENIVLLAGGLALGCVAALATVLPHSLTQQAGAPWATLAALLGIVAIAGAAAGWLASRVVLRAPLLPALRGD